MADDQPDETAEIEQAPELPLEAYETPPRSPEPEAAAPTPDPRDDVTKSRDALLSATRAAVADLERLMNASVERGDHAMMERLRAVAMPLADAAHRARPTA